MQLSPIRNKYITFTFSCRTAGDERTIEWLAKNFPELDIPRNYVFINDTRCKDIVNMLNVCMIQLETDSWTNTEILEIT